MVGHNGKSVRFETHTIQAVCDQALHHVAPEKVTVSDGSSSDKAKIVGSKVWTLVRHFRLSLLARTGMMSHGGLMSRMMGHGHNPQSQSKENTVTTPTYHIPAVNCDHCKMTIERRAGEFAGVASVRVDVDTKQTVVQFVSPAAKDEIETLHSEIGYPPQSQ
jgi:copper chaperone CopZ